MLGGINNSLFLSSFAGFFVLGILILFLRWAFSRGSSVVERPLQRGEPDQYGLLREIASPSNHVEGEMMRQRLMENGIRATLTQTTQGPRLMVFENEVKAAEAILRS